MLVLDEEDDEDDDTEDAAGALFPPSADMLHVIWCVILEALREGPSASFHFSMLCLAAPHQDSPPRRPTFSLAEKLAN